MLGLAFGRGVSIGVGKGWPAVPTAALMPPFGDRPAWLDRLLFGTSFAALNEGV